MWGHFFAMESNSKEMNSEEMQKGESSPASTIGWNIAMHFLPEEFGPQPVGNDSNRKNSFWVHRTIKKFETFQTISASKS